MKQLIREVTALRRLYYRMQMARSRGQSDETEIIARLTADSPRTFVEFGFHPIQFNCAALVRSRGWTGLLIDGNARQVSDARALLPDRIEIAHAFLTLDNLDFIRSRFERLGLLSIDVDGNDYWFLQALIDTRPDVICVEYNASLGFDPITVPYDVCFDRHEKHPSGWYHGASLAAFAKLCASHGYGLAAVSEGGANAFFTERGTLDPRAEWKPNRFRMTHSGKDNASQWVAIKHMPFIAV
jgi:hypothetical protein